MSSVQRHRSGVRCGAVRAPRQSLRGNLRSRALCLTLTVSLLVLPMPYAELARTASETVARVAAMAELDASLAVERAAALITLIRSHLVVLRGFGVPVPFWVPSGSQSQATSPPNPSLVSSITVTPAKHAAFVGDRVAYSAQPRDVGAAVVHGIKFSWSTLNRDKVSIDEAGRATMLAPGLATIVCTAGLATGTALVLVRPGNRRAQSDAQWRLDQGGASFVVPPSGGGSASLVVPDASSRVAASGVPSGGASGPPKSKSDNAPSVLSSLMDNLVPTAHAQSGGGGGSAWTTNPWVIGMPRNGVIESTRFGSVLPESFNYELSIPIVASMGNRELNIPLALYYNSQIWSMTGPTTMQFDPNQSWPAPGFSLGFGRIDTTLSGDLQTAYYTLVEPNSTRRYLGSGPASVTGAPPPYPTYWTNDGSYIAYVGDAVHGGQLYYPSGAKYDINLVNNRLLVTQITSTNGNYIQASYMHTVYDQNGNPIGPVYSPFALNYAVDTLGRQINFGYDTGGTGLLTSVSGPAGGATLTYQAKNLVTNFYSNIYGQQMTVLGAPASIAGLATINAMQYYQMTYSDYGMISSFTMGRSNTATVTFDYPTSGSTQLGGAPAFTQRTESSGSVSGTYSYSVSGVTSTITRPDTSTLTLTDNGSGLLAQSEIKLGTQSYAKMVYTYGNDPGGAPEVTTAKSYDDTGTPRRVDYGYDQYGNVTSKLEYGLQVNGPWLRKTTLTYQGAPYTASFMLNRVIGLNVYDPNNTQIAGTSYSYDGYASIVGYSQQSSAPGHLSNYDSTYTLRGNATTVTRLTNVAQGTSTSRSATYDVFGNQVTINLDCCNQKSLTYAQDTYWSQPDQTTDGGSGGPTVTNSSVYNFNTSGVISRTDQNGLTTNYVNNGWVQPTQINPPSGANFGLGYGDWGDATSSSVSYNDGGVNKTVSVSVTKDGWGNAIQEIDAAGNKVNLGYDNMGYIQSRTNPFSGNGSPGPTATYQFDPLGRLTKATFPDNSVLQTTYSGSNTTSTDQVGRQMTQQLDGLGRLMTVLEQDPSVGGTPSIATNYTYDCLDDLTQLNQGGQIRSWKYDAAGRKLFERIPEQAATINDGTGTMWSCAYTYTAFNKIATKTDARGVITTYGYDTMNRLTSVSYDTSHAPGVASTPGLTYTYDTSTTSTTKGLLLSVTGGVFQESYSYDSINRKSAVTNVIDSKSYTKRYQYNAANQVTQLTYPSQRVLPTTYDSFGRISSVGAYLSGTSYSAAGRLTAFTLGNGVSESFTFDSQRLQLTTQSATKGATTLLSLNYGYSASAGQMGIGTTAGNSGQLASVSGTINGSTESATFAYDLLGRTATSSETSAGTSAQRRFSYDRWGNRNAVWDSTSGGNQIQGVTIAQSGGSATNRIQSISGTGAGLYSYDSAGNVISDPSHSYTYDAENRVTSVDAGTTAQYAYDFGNRRVRKVAPGSTTHYVWEGDRVLAENDGATGVLLADYILALGSFVAKVQASGTASYLLRDRISERLTLDASGNVLGSQGHVAYGEDFAESGQQEKHHFTTYDRDTETGLDYAVNRFYQTASGRFQSVDPYPADKSNPKSWNRYTYVLNDPVNSTDPDGLVCPGGTIPVVGPNGTTICVPVGGSGDDNSDTPSGEPSGGGPARPDPAADLEKQRRDALRKAISNAENRLRKNGGHNPCADFFGGADLAEITLDNTDYSFQDLGRPSTDPETGLPTVTGARTNSSTSVTINSLGPFGRSLLLCPPGASGCNNGTYTPNLAGQTGIDLDALILLHELGHQMGKLGPDAGDPKANAANTAAVKAACF
jgi:RHS repeat-associated protein